MTDYHPKVLENAEYNVKINGCMDTIQVRKLDWFEIIKEDEPSIQPFLTVLAADVIYDK